MISSTEQYTNKTCKQLKRDIKTDVSKVATYVEGFHYKESVEKMIYSPLGNTGMDVSLISYGASSLGGVFVNTDDQESIKVVHETIKRGVNYIDTAAWYGHGRSESVLGKALKDIPRKSYYIATKACRYKPEVTEMFDFSYERTLKSIDESLERLGLDYVDVIQVHDPEFAPSHDIIINETLPAMKKAQEQGKVRFIGLTGFPLGNSKELILKSPCKIDTIISYCHYSLNDTSLVEGLMPLLKEKGIGLINASANSMGLLTNRGPPKWHPATEEIRNVCAEAVKYCQEKDVDIAKLAQHFSLHTHPEIPTCLVGTANLQNSINNIEVVSQSLSEKEEQVMQEIIEKYFKPLNNKTWEGIEVAKYRKDIEQALQEKNHNQKNQSKL